MIKRVLLIVLIKCIIIIFVGVKIKIRFFYWIESKNIRLFIVKAVYLRDSYQISDVVIFINKKTSKFQSKFNIFYKILGTGGSLNKVASE